MSDDYKFIKDVYDRVIYLTKNQHEKCKKDQVGDFVYTDDVLSVRCSQLDPHCFSIIIRGFIDYKSVIIYHGGINDTDDSVLYSIWYCNDKTVEYIKKYIETNIIDIEFESVMELFEKRIMDIENDFMDESISDFVSDFETFGKVDVDLDCVIKIIKERSGFMKEIENDVSFYIDTRARATARKRELQWVLSLFGE